jgi:hypothetical protein
MLLHLGCPIVVIILKYIFILSGGVLLFPIFSVCVIYCGGSRPLYFESGCSGIATAGAHLLVNISFTEVGSLPGRRPKSPGLSVRIQSQ